MKDFTYHIVFDSSQGNQPVEVRLESTEKGYLGTIWELRAKWQQVGGKVWIPLEILSVRNSGKPKSPQATTTRHFFLDWYISEKLPSAFFDRSRKGYVSPASLRKEIIESSVLAQSKR
jgi:hypothetical protein